MRRTLLLLLTLTIALTACGAGGDTTVPAPPQATKVEQAEIAEINQILTQWKTVAPEQMRADAVKPETLEENVYTSPGTLAEVKTHYNSLTNNGWYVVKNLVGAENDQVLLLGYEHGTTALVVGAIDASRFGGSGVVIYTLKGTK
jgi:predicted small lipoprotein YifL